MKHKFATVEGESGPFSLVKHEPAINITHKLEAYQKAKTAQRQNDSKPNHEGNVATIQTYSTCCYLLVSGETPRVSITCSTCLTHTQVEKTLNGCSTLLNRRCWECRRGQRAFVQ